MNLKFSIESTNRKEFVKTIGEILGWEPKYQGTPRCGYDIGSYSLDRNNTLSCPTSATPDIINQLIANLDEKGYKVESTEYDTLVVELPRKLFNDETLEKLKCLIESKANILMKALEATSLPVEYSEETIKFPWFTLKGIEGEAEAYTKLIELMAKMAKDSKRITAKEKPIDNEKFTMRLFLVRLGFVGDEFKTARKILMRNLSGNSSWKSGQAPIKEGGNENEQLSEQGETGSDSQDVS